MDILYIVGKGRSKCDNYDLRYSLRSIEKFGKNVDRIFVAGYCPEWLSDEIVKVPYEQPYDNPHITEKHLNLLSTVLYVIDNTDINDDFLISMDDHYYIRETDFDNYPYYAKIVKGDTELKPGKNPPNRYGQFILSTNCFLKSLDLPTYFFCPHRNMHLSRPIINECRNILERIMFEKLDVEPWAFLINYAYSKNPFTITPIKDIKVKDETQWYKVNPENSEVFSTSDFEINSKLDILMKELYPNKSKYEKSC